MTGSSAGTRVGWLADEHNPAGGDALTQAALRQAAPDGVEVVACRPGAIAECDLYVVHNHMTYAERELPGKVVRYHHDMRPQTIEGDVSIFCSPLQRDALDAEGAVVPPPIDLEAFRPSRQQRRHEK